MTTEYDFLQKPTEEHLRREMNNICDSYLHPWDVLAELLQNAVDAIRLHIAEHGDVGGHTIMITINQVEKSITVRDSGIGIAPSEIPGLLAPHGSDKPKNPELIGEKGVGLTHVIFSTDKFEIETASAEGAFAGNVMHASMWRAGKAERPKLRGEGNSVEIDHNDTFTEITANAIDTGYSTDPENIFHLSFPALACILRTKTAVGSTSDNPESIKVLLTLVERDGKSQTDEVPFAYLYPQELVGDKNYIRYDDQFKDRVSKMNDRGKARYLRGKGLLKIGKVKRAGRKIRYSAFLMPSRKTWGEINRKNKLTISLDDNDEYQLYKAAIEIATKGMPTAVSLDPELTVGKSGYWANFHILIQDDSLPFDIGRKSIPGRTQGLLKEVARQAFIDLTAYAQNMSIDPPIVGTQTVQQFEKREQFQQLKALPDLKIHDLPYMKQPDDQEGAVVAIFHELTAAKHLRGYRTLRTGYKQTYDLWGIYEVSQDTVGANVDTVPLGSELELIIEFKFRLDEILPDFDDDTKRLSDIDLLVCWDLNEKKFASKNMHVELVAPEDALFYGTNYNLFFPAAYNLGSAGEKPVIALRRFIEDLSNQQNR